MNECLVKYVKNPAPKLLVWLLTPLCWLAAHPKVYWAALTAVWIWIITQWLK